MNSFDPGDVARLSLATVDKATGLPTDPSALTCIVRDPAGAQTTYNWPSGSLVISRLDVGSFRVDHPIPAKNASAGVWSYFWTATGNIVGGEAGSFTIRATAVTLP